MRDMSSPKKYQKVYCEKCDSVFNSRSDYFRHYERHVSGYVYESCPIDIIIEKFVKLLKRDN